MKLKLGLFLILTIALTSCGEEEFYEQDISEGVVSQDGPNGLDNPGEDGSDDDSSDNDSSNDGGSTNPTDPTVKKVQQSQSFNLDYGNNKVDILWVIDNSGSMREEQDDIAANFDAFIQDFVSKNVDFKMAITTTDNKVVPNSYTELTSAKLKADETKFKKTFKEMIKVGISGAGTELAFKGSEHFTNNYAVNHFRPDAYYVVVYVSDEAEQSDSRGAEKSTSFDPEIAALDVDHYLSNLRSWKTAASLVKTYAIVNKNTPKWSQENVPIDHRKYKLMLEESNGSSDKYLKSIHANFADTLLNIGGDIADLALSYTLEQKVDYPNEVKVYIDGDEKKINEGWSFDSSSNAVVFEQGAIPSGSSSIKVEYYVNQ